MSLQVLLCPRREDLKTVGRLAIPVTVIQIGLMAMVVAVTIMVRWVSLKDLAGTALGNLYFFIVAIFGMGLLMAFEPLVAQAMGAGDSEAVARAVQRGLILAGTLVLVAGGLLLSRTRTSSPDTPTG